MFDTAFETRRGIEDSAPATRHPLPVTRFKREAERTAVQVGRTMTVDVGTVIHKIPHQSKDAASPDRPARRRSPY